MKITINRRGGFAGTSETLAVKDSNAVVPTTTPLPAMVERIKRLSREYHPEGADFVHYDLQIEDSGSHATISFTDDGSEKAQELVKLVDAISSA